MANAIYPAFLDGIGEEKHHMTSDDIRAVLADAADYTYSSAHDFLDDVPSGARVATVALSSKTWVNGVLDSADFAWTGVTGDQSEQILLYNHDGNGAGADSARQLIAFYDTGMTGMPVTPNGGDINGTVHGSGWFSL
jgi:hypothetical protein